MLPDHPSQEEGMDRRISFTYLAPSGGRGSCLGLRTGVSPHFSTNSKREMLADHERGAASPPSSPMPDLWGCTVTRPRSHTDCARPTLSDDVDWRRDAPLQHCYQHPEPTGLSENGAKNTPFAAETAENQSRTLYRHHFGS